MNKIKKFLNQYSTWDVTVAMFMLVNNIFLLAVSSSFFIWIQLFHATIFIFHVKYSEKIPLCWYCNFLVLPFYVLLLELKIVGTLYSSIKNLLYDDEYYREKHIAKLLNKVSQYGMEYEKKEEPKQIGMSFKNYLEKNDNEFQSLLKQLKEKDEEIIRLKRNIEE